MKKVLWLPAWYPNKTEPWSGDFIQRHARAVSLYASVQVIYLVRDKQGLVTKNIKEENFQNGNLNEKIIYYYIPAFFISFFDKIISNNRYRQLYRKAIKLYLKTDGIPAYTHVHVADKNGLPALWLKRKYNIPFVITEHWTVYLKKAIPHFKNLSWLFRIMWRKIIKASDKISVVSRQLGDAINEIQNISYTVIPNVFDENIFFPEPQKEETVTRFIHVSGLDYQKNPEAILTAFSYVRKTNPQFVLSLFGPPKKELQLLALQLGLEKNVIFYNEMPQADLAAFVRQSHALILYSRYETFGCVLIEANACGVPVIVSDIEVFHEIIQEGVNGYYVAEENPAALADKILDFMKNHKDVPNKAVAQMTKEKYNYEKIGRLFNEFYTPM